MIKLAGPLAEKIRIYQENGVYAIYLSRDIPWKGDRGREAFKDTLKARVNRRRWDNNRKVWIVPISEAATLAAVLKEVFGLEARIVGNTCSGDDYLKQLSETGVPQQVYYLGLPRLRRIDGREDFFALGHKSSAMFGEFVFPQSVLQDYFGKHAVADKKEDNPYVLLGIPPQDWFTITTEGIKRAYRRAARTYHPDVCHEPNAHERFIAIKNAYDLLSDKKERGKYNMALQFEKTISGNGNKHHITNAWSPPLRCGMVTFGKTRVIDKKVVVLSISRWEPIVRSDGCELVTHWDQNAQSIKEEWL